MTMQELMQAEVEISRIEVISNFRRTMNQGKLQELADNVKKLGVLEPVLVRRGEGNDFVLIAGARRLSAAKLAGLSSIPARVMNVDENQAAEIQALENLHREDLGPVDEARAFKALLDLGSHTVESLAERMDKSVSYIYRSLKLLELPDAGLKALGEGVMTAGHAHQILRAPEKEAERLVKFATTKFAWLNRYPTVDELKREIEKTIERDLDTAVFPKDTEFSGVPACTGCPYNTGNQNALFDGAVEGKCTNPGCFSTKTATFYKDLKVKGEKKFSGLPFLGLAVENGYSGPQRIKSAVVVSRSDKKVLKALKAKPEKFGFGILKPGRWSKTKPQLVLLCKDPKVVGVQDQARPAETTREEREKIAFIENHLEKVIWRTVVERFEVRKARLVILLQNVWERGWDRGRVTPLLVALDIALPESDEAALPDSLEKMGLEALTKAALLALGRLAGLEVEQLLGDDASDLQRVVKIAEAEAQKLWRERPVEVLPNNEGDSMEANQR